MKIMFNISSMANGGAERVIANLSNYMVAKHDITIMVNTDEYIGYELKENIKVIALDKKRRNFVYRTFNRFINTVKIIKQEKPDIIISFLPVPSYRILLLKRFYKVPVIVSDRNNPAEEYKKFIHKILMRMTYKKADGFVFQTEEQKNYFTKKIQNNSIIIPNPIKDEFLEIVEREKQDIIINTGRLVPQKNQKMLISAFAETTKQNDNYKLKIFGEGPLKESLQQQIDELGIGKKVELCGVSKNIKKELEQAKVFVLSSDFEGMPNALIEAMATGLACISTDCPCGGPRELIEDGKNGILIPKNNKQVLQEKISLLISDDEIRKDLGENAKKVKEKLEISIIANRWEQYIDKISNNYR